MRHADHSYSPGPGAAAESRTRASIAARLRTRWRKLDLDRALAAGVDPAQNELLTLRAEQLTTRTARESLARSLVGSIELAEMSALATARIRLRRRAIRDARPELLGLARRLREPEPVGPQAPAMTSHLVSDAGSPLYENALNPSLRGYVLEASGLIDDVRVDAAADADGPLS